MLLIDLRPPGCGSKSQATSCSVSRPTLDLLATLRARCGLSLDAIVYALAVTALHSVAEAETSAV